MDKTTQTEERTFTQEDVNRIIQERLERERNRSGQSLEEKEKELARRESRIACAERLAEKQYPRELLELLDTSDADRFMESVERLAVLGLGQAGTPRAVAVTPGIEKEAYEDKSLREAFGLKKKEG